MDYKELSENLAKMVKQHVAESVAKVQTQIDGLTAALKELPIPKDGIDGKDADIKALQDYIDTALSKFTVPKDGTSVTLADVMPEIEKAINEKIDALPKAKDGIDGEHGIDGIDIEILPAINTDKCYPRGVYASHNGGLWKSHANTDGMKGWECIIDGIADINIDKEDRIIKINIAKASGSIVTKEFITEEIIYRDVYREGTEYQKGDIVTLGGSAWHCNELTSERPGETKAWKLAVRKGRDYKEPVKVGP